MVKYLFVIFYLCVVMFLNLGHGETCGDGRRGNVRYMNANKMEVDHQTYSLPMTFRLISLYMGSPLSHIYVIIYDREFPRFPRPAHMASEIPPCAGSRPSSVAGSRRS